MKKLTKAEFKKKIEELKSLGLKQYEIARTMNDEKISLSGMPYKIDAVGSSFVCTKLSREMRGMQMTKKQKNRLRKKTVREVRKMQEPAPAKKVVNAVMYDLLMNMPKEQLVRALLLQKN